MICTITTTFPGTSAGEISSPDHGHPLGSRGTPGAPPWLSGDTIQPHWLWQPASLQAPAISHAAKQAPQLSPGHLEQGGESREGGGKHARPHQPIHTSPRVPRQGGAAAGAGFFDRIRPSFALRGQSGEECERPSRAQAAKARPPLPTPCLRGQVC